MPGPFPELSAAELFAFLPLLAPLLSSFLPLSWLADPSGSSNAACGKAC